MVVFMDFVLISLPLSLKSLTIAHSCASRWPGGWKIAQIYLLFLPLLFAAASLLYIAIECNSVLILIKGDLLRLLPHPDLEGAVVELIYILHVIDHIQGNGLHAVPGNSWPH